MKIQTVPVSIAFLCAFSFVSAESTRSDNATSTPTHPTARELVERIKANVHVPWNPSTVDTFKAGDPDVEVTGVVTTHLDTLDVLQRAAAAGKNFVITHEPTFYNHLDRTEQLAGDKVLAEKQDFIRKHNMVVFRFHDHWHRMEPDGIDVGMTRKIGWDKFRRLGERAFFDIPPITLADLAAELKTKLGASVVRVVGKPQAVFTKIGMLPGAAGSAAHIKMLERDDVEVLVIGEAQEWETVEYVRDAVTEGKPKALVLLGHANSEEAGMDYCAEWLRGFIKEVPIEFIPAGDPLWSPAIDMKHP